MTKLFIWLAIAAIPLVSSYRLNSEENSLVNNTEIKSMIENETSQNVTISLKQFAIYNRLGEGAGLSGSVIHVVQKIGGSDDGKFYVLKAITHDLFIHEEREMLEAARNLPWVTKLQYAFREGKWVFLVLGLGGGNLFARAKENPPDLPVVKVVLAEIITAIEALHKVNILHGDISPHNTLIDDEGHIVLTDFGWSKWSDSYFKDMYNDWGRLPRLCNRSFSEQLQNEKSLIEFFETMNLDDEDKQIPELKNLPFFEGIDWEKVQERKSDPPFKPDDIKINLDCPFDADTLFAGEIDEETEAALAKEFQNLLFIAPEHQN